ncbi:MAG: chromate transporter [Yoonia sp.]|jgi:chromate transporter
MMDTLGLTETTPGSLILVRQFVGMIAGVLTLWVTFVPCFICIFAGAPLIDWLDGRPRLRGALAAITAVVVGVIANISLWFALHVFFATVKPLHWDPVHSISRHLATLQLLPVCLAEIAAILLLGRGWSLPRFFLFARHSAEFSTSCGASSKPPPFHPHRIPYADPRSQGELQS